MIDVISNVLIKYCSNTEQWWCPDTEQDDTLRTIPFLREKFGNHLLCTFRNNSAWLKCQYVLRRYFQLNGNQHHLIWNSFLGKQRIYEWRDSIRFILSFLWIEGVAQSGGLSAALLDVLVYAIEDQACEMNMEGSFREYSLWENH